MLRKLSLTGYVLFAPWATWFALTGWLRLPVDFLLIALLLFTPLLLHRLVTKPKTLVVSDEDWLLVVVCALVWFSYFFYGSGTEKSFNHALSFSFCFLCYLVVFKRMWLDSGFSLGHLMQVCMWAVVLADGIVILEWTLLNIFNIIIRTYFLFTDKVVNMIYYDQIYWKSVGGVAEEPSLMAFNVNALFPIGWYYLRSTRGGLKTTAFLVMHLAALLCTASSGGIAFILIAFSAAYLLEFKKDYWVAFGLALCAILLASFIGFFFLPPNIQSNLESLGSQVLSKVTLVNVSAQMRTDAWSKGWEDFLASPWFGRGPAYGHEAYRGFGYQSTYIKMLAETGIFSLGTFFVFLGIVFYKVRTIALPLRHYLTIGFVACAPHWAIADCYYHVSFWLTIAVIQLVHLEAKQPKKPTKVLQDTAPPGSPRPALQQAVLA